MAGPFDRIFADTRKDIPSVTDAVLRQELFRVMDDFTQTTNLWQEHVPVTTVANDSILNFATATGKPNRLIVTYADAPSAEPLISPPVARNVYPTNPTFWPLGRVIMPIPGILQFYQPPTGAFALRVVVAKHIAEPLSADKYPVIDDWIVDKYADTIGRGIIARLMLEPQKPYSNPMLAAVNQRAYIAGRSLARVNAEHGHLLNGQNWRYPQGWATVQPKGFV